MLRSLRFVLLVLLGGTVLGCDQAAKSLARRVLFESGPLELAGGTVRLALLTNRGGFLGLGSGLDEPLRFWAFTFAVALVLAGTAVVAVLGEQTPGRLLGLALIVGGGAGNLVDRLIHSGEVVDFILLRVGPLRTGVFNLADVAILVGVLVVITGDARARVGRRRAGEARSGP